MASNTITHNGRTLVLERICKLPDLEQGTFYEVVDVKEKRSNYNSYVVVIKKDSDDCFKVYMNQRIGASALPSRVFVYNGMKDLGNGKQCHMVDWYD